MLHSNKSPSRTTKVGLQRFTKLQLNLKHTCFRTMRGLKTTSDHYSPIFAVVMRRPGATRLLECHAFVCETEEDAVAAAATLYRSLLADLDANRRRPRHTNGVGCMSIASVASSAREPSPNSRLSTRMNILQSEAIRSTPQHPVRPPRTKKTSVSSSVTEEETEKSSGLQKAPRRKKKNSDIKAEDVLEARGRRKEASPKEKIDPVVQSFSSIQTNFDSKVSKKEERENSKNKTFGIKQELNAPEKIEVENSNNSANKIYDIGANGFYETVYNKYEKHPIIGKAGKVESPAQETPIKEADDAKERMYEKSHGSYDLNNPASSRDASKDQETHSARSDVIIYDRIERPDCKSEENALYERALKRNSKERLYEEHFKDVDKIYSLAQEEIYSGRGSKLGPGKIKSSQEDIFFGRRDNNNEIYQLSQESRGDSVSVERKRSRDQEKIIPGRRVSRVVTMDKPLKKQLSDSTSNLNLIEHNQPRVRKRSRAGSEPPVSRSEDATKALEETRLKRSQSDIDVDRGDLMTRVELPRRGSFLNPGSARRPNSIKGGTPLGFTELFDEFRNQEGLTSVDDILAAIIGKY